MLPTIATVVAVILATAGPLATVTQAYPTAAVPPPVGPSRSRRVPNNVDTAAGAVMVNVSDAALNSGARVPVPRGVPAGDSELEIESAIQQQLERLRRGSHDLDCWTGSVEELFPSS